MKDDIYKIINDLYEDEITCDMALKYISELENKKLNIKSNQIDKENNKKVERAKKLKIMVHDLENNKKINIPKLSIKFLTRISSFGINIAKKYSDEIPENFKEGDLKKILEGLMDYPPYNIVDVETPEAIVHIYTC